MESVCKKYVDTVVLAMGGQGVPIEYQLLQKHGQVMTPTPSKYRGTMTENECFNNAYKLLAEDDRFSYCEGYATTEKMGVPLSHAWVIDADGLVIDPTWTEGNDYFGVCFSRTMLYRTLCITRYHGVLGNLYRLRMPPADCLAYLENGLQSIAVCV